MKKKENYMDEVKEDTERISADAALAVEGTTAVIGGLATSIFNVIALLIAFIFPILIGLVILVPLLIVEEEYPAVIADLTDPTNAIENTFAAILLYGYDTVALIVDAVKAVINAGLYLWDLIVPVLYWLGGLLWAVFEKFVQVFYGSTDLQCIMAESAWMFESVLDTVLIGIRNVGYSVKRTFVFDRQLISNISNTASSVRRHHGKSGKRFSSLGYDIDNDKFVISQETQDKLQFKGPGALGGPVVFDVVNTDQTQAEQIEEPNDAPCCQPLGSDAPCNSPDTTTDPTCPSDSVMINYVTPIIDIVINMFFQFISFVIPFIVLFFQTLIHQLITLIPALLDSLQQIVSMLVSSGIVPLMIQFLHGLIVTSTGVLRILCILVQQFASVIASIAKFLISIIDSVVLNIYRSFTTWSIPYTCNILFQDEITAIEQFLATMSPFGKRHVKMGKRIASFSEGVVLPNYARGSERFYEMMAAVSRNSISDLTKSEAIALGYNVSTSSIRDPMSPLQHKRTKQHHNQVERDMGIAYPGYDNFNHYLMERHKLMHRIDYAFLKSTTLHLSPVVHWLVLATTGAHGIVYNSDFMFTLVSRRPAFFQEQTKATVSHLAFHSGLIDFDSQIGGPSTYDGSFDIRKHHKKGSAREQIIPVEPTDFFDVISYQCDSDSFDDGHIWTTDNTTNVSYEGGSKLNDCIVNSVDTADCTPEDQCDCFGIWTYNDPFAISPGPNCSCKTNADCGGPLFNACAEQCLGDGNGQAAPQNTFSCQYYSHVCLSILAYSQVYNRSSPDFNQTKCDESPCAQSCGLCNTLVCSTDSEGDTVCEVCYSESPCLSNLQTAAATNDYLGSDTSNDKPTNCTATDQDYDTTKGDPCYTCLGNSIPGYTTNQGCTTCGGMQEKAGSPTSTLGRPLSTAGICGCTSVSTDPTDGATTYTSPCDPQLDPNCTTNMANSNSSNYDSVVPNTYTTTQPTNEGAIRCAMGDLNAIIEDLLREFKLIVQMFVALLSQLPEIAQIIMSLISDFSYAAAVWVVQLADGTWQILQFFYNVSALSQAMDQDMAIYQNSSASYAQFLASFGDQQEVVGNVLLANPSRNPSRLGQMNFAILPCDPTFTNDNDDETYRTCPTYSCCSSDPNAADFCKPPIRAINDFTVHNFTQELESEFYCNYTQLNEKKQQTLEEPSRRHINIEKIQYIARTNPLLAHFRPISKEKLNRIVKLVNNMKFGQILDIAHDDTMQNYYLAIDMIRSFLEDAPTPETDVLNLGDPAAFAQWTFEGINPSSTNNETLFGRLSRGFRKLFVDYTYVMEELMISSGNPRRHASYVNALHGINRKCASGLCSDTSIPEQDDTHNTGVCNNTLPLHCRCQIINGKCRSHPSDPYCCCDSAEAILKNPFECCKGLPGCFPMIPKDLRLPIVSRGDFAWMAVFSDPETCEYCRSDKYSGFIGANVDWFIGGLKIVLFLLRSIFNEPVKLFLSHIGAEKEPSPFGSQAVYDTFVNYSKSLAYNINEFFLGWLMFPNGTYPNFALFCLIMNIGNLVYLCFVLSILALLIYAFQELIVELIDFAVNVGQSRQVQELKNQN